MTSNTMECWPRVPNEIIHMCFLLTVVDKPVALKKLLGGNVITHLLSVGCVYTNEGIRTSYALH